MRTLNPRSCAYFVQYVFHAIWHVSHSCFSTCLRTHAILPQVRIWARMCMYLSLSLYIYIYIYTYIYIYIYKTRESARARFGLGWTCFQKRCLQFRCRPDLNNGPFCVPSMLLGSLSLSLSLCIYIYV